MLVYSFAVHTTSKDLVNDGKDLHTTLNTYLQYISLFLVYISLFLIPLARLSDNPAITAKASCSSDSTVSLNNITILYDYKQPYRPALNET